MKSSSLKFGRTNMNPNNPTWIAEMRRYPFRGKQALEANGYVTSGDYYAMGFFDKDPPGWRLRTISSGADTAPMDVFSLYVPWQPLNTYQRTLQELEKQWGLLCGEISIRHEVWLPGGGG